MTPDSSILGERRLPGGRWIQIIQMSYGKARLYIGQANCDVYDDGWCYDNKEGAMQAMAEWDPFIDPEPAGWMRHPATGRRRPDGDPKREFVRP